MIAAITGTPGSGKTYTCVKTIVDDLCKGRVVVTNVKLVDDWAYQVVNSGWRRVLPRSAKEARARELERYYRFVESMEELLLVWVDRPAKYARSSEGLCEGWWTVVLDEAHQWLNNRQWKDDNRQIYGSWFAEHRKVGADVFLLSQHMDAIDKQVRDRVEYKVTLKNLRRVRIAGIPLVPFNYFLAIWEWTQGATAGKRQIAKRRFYGLDWRRGLYDTFQTYGRIRGLNAIVMPRPVNAKGPEAVEPPSLSESQLATRDSARDLA